MVFILEKLLISYLAKKKKNEPGQKLTAQPKTGTIQKTIYQILETYYSPRVTKLKNRGNSAEKKSTTLSKLKNPGFVAI